MPFQLETIPKIYPCPACNAEMKVYSAKSELVACLSCGSAFRFTSDRKKLKPSYKNTHYRSATFIDVGMVATIDGTPYRVLARLHCIEKCFELTEDEGDQIYEADDWRYEEYVLENANGEHLYIIYDEEGYWINYPIQPDLTTFPPINQVPSYMQLFRDEPKKQIEEHGNVTVDAFAGELDYDPRLGKQLFRYALYVQGDEDFVLEYNRHADETEAFRERQLDETEAIGYFGGDENAEKALNKVNFRKFASICCLAAALLSLLYILHNEFKAKEIVLDKYFNLGYVTDSGYVVGPFYVDEANTVYELTLKSDFSGYKNYDVTAHILNEKQNVVNDIGAEFYREADDEGEYSNNAETEKFRATETGNYYVRVYSPSTGTFNDIVTVQVAKGGMAVIFPFLTFLLFSAAWVSIQPKHIKTKLFSEAGLTILIIAVIGLGALIL